MKLRFISPYAPLKAKAGDVQTVADEKGRELIRRNYARPVQEESQTADLPKAETAVKKTKK